MRVYEIQRHAGYVCHPNMWEAEARALSRVVNQPGIHGEFQARRSYIEDISS